MRFHRVLVTGGAGFIGSHIVDALLARGAEVVVYDNFCTGRAEYLPSPAPRQLSAVRADVQDLAALEQAMKGCDFVFHWQANADVRGGRDQPRLDLEKNTLTTWNVLEAMRRVGVKHLAFASSSAVYGEPEVFPTPEDYPLVQTSLYGASKLAGEAMIQAFCEYYDMRCYLYRFVSWIGERYSHGVVFDFMRKLMQDPTRLQILGDGSQRKSYLYVKDGVAGILLGIEESTARKNIYNLGHHEYLDVVAVTRIVLDELGLKNVKLEFTGGCRGWVGDSPFVHLDTTRIRALGWQPETSIEEGLRRTVRFLDQNRHILRERV
jgi:UDP-glucose 4-epimerase